MPLRHALFMAILLVLSPAIASATTAYVTDQTEVTLRNGTSTGHRILRLLPSGTRLEVLETDAASGYSRVRTSAGQEGWILSRFLQDEPIARDQLKAARQQLAELTADENSAASRIAQLRQELGQLRGERDTLTQQNQQLQTQLANLKERAAEPLKIAEENRALKNQLAAARELEATLRADNRRLRNKSARNWFLTGGGVLLGGILLGLLLPHMRLGRRRRWNEL